MVYAARTDIAVDKTRGDIEKMLARYGADRFAYFKESGMAIIVFEAHQRRLRFNLPLPGGKDNKSEQAERSKWRALLLCIKAKLESVESKIETFEDAFLAHIVMPDGETVSHHIRPRLAESYAGGKMLALMPPTQRAE